MKVLAIKTMAFLDTNSGGLHFVDKLSLWTIMHGYYVQADGIPQYIIMLEEAQKKAKRVGMPITNIKLAMMVFAAVLAVMHFPRKVDDWEGLPMTGHTRLAWKKGFHSTHLKCQRQILASWEESSMGECTVCFPRIHRRRLIASRPHSTTWHNNTAMLQQLKAANLGITNSVTVVTATNKKLVDAAATCPQGASAGTRRERVVRPAREHQKIPSLVTTAGRTATSAARSTRVPPASTKPRATGRMQQWQTP